MSRNGKEAKGTGRINGLDEPALALNLFDFSADRMLGQIAVERRTGRKKRKQG